MSILSGVMEGGKFTAQGLLEIAAANQDDDGFIIAQFTFSRRGGQIYCDAHLAGLHRRSFTGTCTAGKDVPYGAGLTREVQFTTPGQAFRRAGQSKLRSVRTIVISVADRPAFMEWLRTSGSSFKVPEQRMITVTLEKSEHFYKARWLPASKLSQEARELRSRGTDPVLAVYGRSLNKPDAFVPMKDVQQGYRSLMDWKTGRYLGGSVNKLTLETMKSSEFQVAMDTMLTDGLA